MPRLGDELIGDVLCPWLQPGAPSSRSQSPYSMPKHRLSHRERRTSCRCHSAPAWNRRTRCTSRSSSPRRAGFGPSYASRFSVGENRCSGSAVFSAVAASPWPRRAVGPEEGDRGEVAKSAVQSNEMPVAPDRVCPIRSFTPLGAGRNRAGTPGRCRRSKRARPAPPRPPSSGVKPDGGS